MKEFIIKFSKYFLIIAIIANVLALISSHSLKNSSIFKSSFLINNFNREIKFDYIIIGSSRGLTSLGTREIDKELGTYGLNLSQDDTGLPSQILMTKHFFESGYKSDYCILVLDETHFEKSSLEINDNDYRMAPFIDRDYIYNYFKEKEEGIIRPYTLGRILPAILYAYYNTELLIPSIFTIFKPEYRHRFDDRGNYFYPENTSDITSNNFHLDKKAVSINNPLINDLKKYLEEKDSKLIIYIAPYQFTEFEISNHSTLLIINHSNILKEKNLFYDPIHLNKSGMKKASLLFSKEFSINVLENHRTVQ